MTTDVDCASVVNRVASGVSTSHQMLLTDLKRHVAARHTDFQRAIVGVPLKTAFRCPARIEEIKINVVDVGQMRNIQPIWIVKLILSTSDNYSWFVRAHRTATSLTSMSNLVVVTAMPIVTMASPSPVGGVVLICPSAV